MSLIQRCVTVAAAIVVALAGPSVSARAQVGDGSVGTVQVSTAPVDATVETDPGVSVTVTGAPASTGQQTATSSVGIVQAQTPQVTASAGSAPSSDGTAVSPDTSFGVESEPGTPEGPQTTDDSIGTLQVGGGPAQHAAGSVGSVQVSDPAVSAEGSFVGPLRPDMPDGLATPETELAGAIAPEDGGSQAVSGSAASVQVGSGPQSSDDSAGTVQAGLPSGRVGTSSGGAEPTSAEASTVLAWEAGGQRVSRSVGTMQLGGGEQSTDGSLGAGQLSMSSVSLGTGDTAATGPGRSDGGAGSATSAASAPGGETNASPPAPPADAVEPPAEAEGGFVPFGGTLDATGRSPSATPSSGTLPFTGLALATLLLLGTALIASGVLVRSRSATQAG